MPRGAGDEHRGYLRLSLTCRQALMRFAQDQRCKLVEGLGPKQVQLNDD
ncbi:MAG: hypothetical protein OXN89_00055 [Bryobacterales bacterium]|nr:hypothetical protein [Bryobacterales bacterium]